MLSQSRSNSLKSPQLVAADHVDIHATQEPLQAPENPVAHTVPSLPTALTSTGPAKYVFWRIY
jgi:hypothetical protein